MNPIVGQKLIQCFQAFTNPQFFSIKDFFFNGKKGNQSNVSRQIDKYIGSSTRSTVRKKVEAKKSMKWQGDIAFLFLVGLFLKESHSFKRSTSTRKYRKSLLQFYYFY